ncbi:MAG TPA: AMIN domain-containing protein [Terriglobales bacterium]|nr:AMIN domain-containing protein [Terriglobales bacterium]
MSRFRAKSIFVMFLALAAIPAAAQTRAKAHHSAEVQSVRVIPDDNGSVLEIVATRPLTPKLQTVEGPLRLVVDLPDATLNIARKKLSFRNEQIKAVRMDQYQTDPAVTRVVIDLASPVRYTWDAMGNRLRVRLRGDEAAVSKPASIPSLSMGPQPIAVPVAIGTSGSLIEAGSRVSSGSSIIAGEETAILRLSRGGEVRVCPGTSLSVSASTNGQNMMLGMSKGAMETHYGLRESVDSVLTPDFRIVLPGPGEFNLAISADSHGNTCVESLPGSTSSAVIAELLGNGTYEIKPEQQLMFRGGHINAIEAAVSSCGCPAAQPAVLRASADPPAMVPQEKATGKLQLENSDASASKSDTPSTSPLPNTDPPNQAKSDPPPDHMKVSLEAPLVFSGRDIAKARASATQANMQQAAALPLTSKPSDPLPAIVVLPPPDPKPAHKGFFGKVKGFFGSVFH